jgi:hypothetical protein
MTPQHSSTIAKTLTAIALLVAATGCEQYPLHDLGYTNGNPSGSNDEPDEPLPVAEFASDFGGVWLGEAEDPFALQSTADGSPPIYRFPSGSRRIRLELVPSGSGHFSMATITFGEGTPPAPATDPAVGYPVDPNFDVHASGHPDISIVPPSEGFAYGLSSGSSFRDLEAGGITPDEQEDFSDQGRVLDGMIRLLYTPKELFGSWCELQTPETCRVNRGYFVGEGDTCFHGDDAFPTDCQKMVQCEYNTCFCEADYCTYSPDLSSELMLRLSDDGLVGLFSGAVFVNERGFQQSLGTVHFRREPE